MRASKKRSVASLTTQIDARKNRIAAERDKLRELSEEANAIAEDCNEAIDDLDRAVDCLSDLTDGLERMAALAKRSHTYCEDGWYSCPKAEDGCYNESRGPECDCGADEHNAEVEALLVELLGALRSNAALSGGEAVQLESTVIRQTGDRE